MKKSSIGFDLSQIRRNRVADQCVCCGSSALNSSPAVLMPFVAHRVFGWEPAVIDASWGLNTIPQGVAYTVCRSLQCECCGLLFCDIRFSDHELERLYTDYRGPEYTALRERYEPGYALRNMAFNERIDYGGILEQFLVPLLPTGPLSILDWGGDSGKNTPLQQRAVRHDIFDISSVSPIVGANSISKNQLSDHYYDLIVCSNVLEHVPYPGDLLEEIRAKMQDGCVLYIEVPYEEIMCNYSTGAMMRKHHWHEHINFFTERSMELLIFNIGLRIVRTNSIDTISAGLKHTRILQYGCVVA